MSIEENLKSLRRGIEEAASACGRRPEDVILVAACKMNDRDRVRRAVAEEAGDGFRVRTRDELRASFYRIMTYEKWGIFFIALLVLLSLIHI